VTGERLISMAVGALIALAAVVGGALVAEAVSGPDNTWPQVTRCEVVQPEDLERAPS
jgi:hypothetical protein